MIPLRDDNPRGRFPFVTVLLILTNIAVFAYQRFYGPLGFENYIKTYGLVSHHFMRNLPFSGLTFFTAMFMHGSFFHIISNMWFLWIFGDNVEDALGKIRYLSFYLVTGILAFIAHMYANGSSTFPLVGASGAIAGVLGAYFLLFPGHRILTLVPILFFVTTVHVPAAFFLGIWFLLQLLASPMGGSIAWWAHIGGFVSGMALVRIFQKRRS